MHRKIYAAVAACASLSPHGAALAQADYSVSSPDGSISVSLQVGAKEPPRYQVTRYGDTVIAPSQLRLHLVGDRGFEVFDALSSKRRSVDEQYRWVVGKTSQARDRFNEVTVSLREQGGATRRLDIILRAYDDGVALRYFIPGQQSRRL